MIICHSRRFILFSAPKTGSESLRAGLAPLAEVPVRPWRQTRPDAPFYPHMPPAAAAAVFAARGWDFAAYRRVTVIRDPFARLVSLYRMIAAVDGVWQARRRAGLGTPSFARWLAQTRSDGRGGGGRRHQRWRRHGAWSAWHWSHDAAGRPLVTDLIPLDRLDDAWPGLCADLDLPPRPLPYLNARRGAGVPLPYDADSAALVAARYAWDIAYLKQY